MRDKKYAVGQLIYLFSSKNNNLYPAVITEQITIERVSGSTVSYRASVIDAENAKKTIKIDDHLADSGFMVFESIDKLREELLARARLSIDEFIAHGVQRAAILEQMTGTGEKDNQQPPPHGEGSK